MENIQNYLTENPVWGGVMITGIGIFLLLGAIFDWDFIFGMVNTNNFNTNKIDGIINLFGRKTARVVMGIMAVLVIVGGLFWTWVYLRN